MGLIKKPSLKGRKRAPRKQVKLVTVNVPQQICISGNFYGPGRCEVPESVARMLKDTLRHRASEESHLYEKRARIITRGNRVVPVPYETFNELLNAVEPNVNIE